MRTASDLLWTLSHEKAPRSHYADCVLEKDVYIDLWLSVVEVLREPFAGRTQVRIRFLEMHNLCETLARR